MVATHFFKIDGNIKCERRKDLTLLHYGGQKQAPEPQHHTYATRPMNYRYPHLTSVHARCIHAHFCSQNGRKNFAGAANSKSV